MAGYMTRSISMSPVEATSPEFPNGTQDTSVVQMQGSPKFSSDNASRRMYQSSQTNLTSPLKIFVQAKKKVNDIFCAIKKHVNESSTFIQNTKSTNGSVVEGTQIDAVTNYNDRVSSIQEVLSRDHMKVAFFGRTSNGKSTVINGMLGDKILPSGIGHTTNCFLQVEGSETGDAYLLTEDSKERKNVKSVGQLGHALCAEKLGESSLVRIFWPKDKCPLLRDDVVFVDSPGVDVSPNLDEWIDKHCLDADVFVLVANAESTLMTTEKKFFYKVSEKLSKPNIFILNNRWDASASEPELIDEVRKQHMERNISFLVDELNVVSKEQAEDRVFFVSAKEVLQARLQQQKGHAPHTGAVADGFQNRYFEFQDFEKKFEECISKSAVKTKFQQHTQQGKSVSHALKDIMETIGENAHLQKQKNIDERKEICDRLDFTDKQLNILTQEMKDKITEMMAQVEQKVSNALSEEIRRLYVLVDEFEYAFNPEISFLNMYKRELHKHVEHGLGSNMRARLSNALSMSIENTQKEMTERLSSLLPPEHKQQILNVLPHRDFEVLYRLNCDNVCADFNEDIEFHFSLGLSSIINRLFPLHDGRRKLSYIDPRQAPLTPQTPCVEKPFPSALPPDYWTIIQKVALVSPTSQTAIGAMALGGFLARTVGWRPIAVGAIIYGGLYMYEKITWTKKAQERILKKQYVQYATRKLRLVVDITSANCSHQVQQELSSTFARLCHLVDGAKTDMQTDISRLNNEVSKLQSIANMSKILRNKAGYLISEIDTFTEQYLQYDD